MCPTVEPMSAPDPLHDLGVRAGADGGEIRVWSEHATSVDLVIFDADDLDWASERTPLTRDDARRVERRLGGARAGRALRPAGRRPGRIRPRVQPGALAARSLRHGPREGPRRLVARRRAGPADRVGLRLGRRRQAAHPARPLGHLRGAPARLLEAQHRDPRAAARHLRRPRPRRARSSTSRASASRPSNCCPCTRSSPSSGSCGRASSTTGATTRSRSSPRTRPTRRPRRRPRARQRCGASSPAW